MIPSIILFVVVQIIGVFDVGLAYYQYMRERMVGWEMTKEEVYVRCSVVRRPRITSTMLIEQRNKLKTCRTIIKDVMTQEDIRKQYISDKIKKICQRGLEYNNGYEINGYKYTSWVSPEKLSAGFANAATGIIHIKNLLYIKRIKTISELINYRKMNMKNALKYNYRCLTIKWGKFLSMMANFLINDTNLKIEQYHGNYYDHWW